MQPTRIGVLYERKNKSLFPAMNAKELLSFKHNVELTTLKAYQGAEMESLKVKQDIILQNCERKHKLEVDSIDEDSMIDLFSEETRHLKLLTGNGKLEPMEDLEDNDTKFVKSLVSFDSSTDFTPEIAAKMVKVLNEFKDENLMLSVLYAIGKARKITESARNLNNAGLSKVIPTLMSRYIDHPVIFFLCLFTIEFNKLAVKDLHDELTRSGGDDTVYKLLSVALKGNKKKSSEKADVAGLIAALAKHSRTARKRMEALGIKEQLEALKRDPFCREYGEIDDALKNLTAWF